MHARAVGVEDPGHLDPQLVLAVVVEEQGFGAALAFVVAGARTDRVHVAPVALLLGVNRWVAVDLRRRGLEDLRLDTLGQAQHVDGAMDGCLCRLNGVELVVHGRGGAGEVVDLVHFHEQREGHVVTHRLEVRIVEKVDDVVARAREVVVHTQHVVSEVEQLLAQVGAQKARTARDQNPLAQRFHPVAFRAISTRRVYFESPAPAIMIPHPPGCVHRRGGAGGLNCAVACFRRRPDGRAGRGGPFIRKECVRTYFLGLNTCSHYCAVFVRDAPAFDAFNSRFVNDA